MSGQEDSRCRAADNCDEEQVVQRMSVSVKKSCFDEVGIYNLDEHLKKIQMKQLERKHVVVVHIEKSDNSHQLEGCFCGIKAVRKELQQILTEKMKEKQKQDEIRNEKKRLENKQTMLTETNETKRQNVSGEILKTRTHYLPMDKDLFDYLEDNCHGELKALCSSIKYCEIEKGFAIEIKFNTDEDIAKIKNDISALQNRFVVREQKVSEAVDFTKLKDEVTRMATQKKNNATRIFDQKTVKVIGSPKEADEMMQWILTLSAIQHSDVKDKNVIKNEIETENEEMKKDSDPKSLTMEEAKRDQNKTLIDHSKPDYPDRRGTTKDSKTLSDDTMGDDSKTLSNNTSPHHLDKQDTTKNDTKDDSKALIGDTHAEHQHENIKAKAETREDAKKTLNDNTKSEISNNRYPSTDRTRGHDAKTQTDYSMSHPDNNGTSKHEGMEHDKKTSSDDNNSERQGKEVTTNEEMKVDDKNAPIDSSKSENQNKQDPAAYQNDTKGDDKKITGDDTNAEHPNRKVTSSDETGFDYNNMPIDSVKSENPDKKETTTDDTKEDTKTLIDETTSEHADKEAASKLTTKGINAEDTTQEHDSAGVSGKESNIKLDICEKGEATDRNKENIRDNEARKLSKTGNTSEYNNESQGNQSPGATAADNYPPQQPTKQRKLAHHISMDKDVYEYIQGSLHQELEEINECCNSVQELKDEDSIVKLCYTLKCEVEDETVKRRFQMLIDQVKVEGYTVPDLINASVLECVVCASTKSEATMIFVQSETNSLKIVGRPDRVDELKQRIDETVSEQLQSQEQLSKGNMYTSEQPCKQYHEKNAYHHITIDENLYIYISTHCQQEIDKASKRCTSIKASPKGGSTFTIDLALQDKRDEGFVTRIFEKLKGQFKVEECKVPNGIDFDNLACAVKDMNTLKEVMIFPLKEKHLMKLIGPNAQVSKTKQWIESLISDSLKSEQLSKHKPHHSSPIKDQPQDSRQSKPVVFTSLQNVNPVNPPRKPGERFKITSIASDTLVYESKRVKNRLTVRVHHANIIKQNTDVLVSYEDEWLQSHSVLAMAMKEAAGPNVTRELSDISRNRGRLEVGQVVHTSSGKLWPSVKYLAHVIRAERSKYHPEDPKTFEILYQTFLNCFKYTNSKVCRNSISIPPIGARKYGVQLVSAAFFQAVTEYDATAEARPAIPLRSIHFVDQDPAVVQQMIKSIKSLLE